jgi:tetratricopeptide (TPR) repeat protein
VLLKSLREFIAQPDYPTLVLNARDADLVYPNRTLAAFDREDEQTYYLLFPQACADAQSYMNVIAASLREQLEVLETELPGRGQPPLPDLPLAVGDARYPPEQRLRSAVEFLGEHLPGDAPIAWGLLPGELQDTAGYRALVAPLLALERVEPWMDRHRFILRDQQARPSIVSELLAMKNDRVLVMDLDFSNESFVLDLVATAGDGNQPAAARMNAFFQLAAVDVGFRRFPEAIEKLGVCFNYFQQTGDRQMQASCLSGAGDTLLQTERPAEALERYQQALALAVEEKSLPLIQQSSFGAGQCCLVLSRDAEAEGYFKHADDAAARLFNPFAKADAMEKRGLARWRLGQADAALDIWLKSKELAKQFAYLDRAVSILDHLIAVAPHSALYPRQRELQAERAQLEAERAARAGGPAPTGHDRGHAPSAPGEG